METAIFSINGLHCQNCVASVTRNLLALSGVVEANVTLQPAKAVIGYDPERCNLNQLKNAVEDLGFDVVG